MESDGEFLFINEDLVLPTHKVLKTCQIVSDDQKAAIYGCARVMVDSLRTPCSTSGGMSTEGGSEVDKKTHCECETVASEGCPRCVPPKSVGRCFLTDVYRVVGC